MAGKGALLRAEQAFQQGRLDLVRDHLAAAGDDFRRMDQEFSRLGPLLWVGRVTPVVRIQVRGVENLADAGQAVAEAGTSLTDAAAVVFQPRDDTLPVSGAIDASATSTLRSVPPSASWIRRSTRWAPSTATALRAPRRRPLGAVGPPSRRGRQCGRGRGRRGGADISVMGADGSRRYLLMSQNPARCAPPAASSAPTGCWPPTVSAWLWNAMSPSRNWLQAHPDAVVPAEEAGSPFRFYEAHPVPLVQSLANVNNVPDWPQAAQLAIDLWDQGGEKPVTGSFRSPPPSWPKCWGSWARWKCPATGDGDEEEPHRTVRFSTPNWSRSASRPTSSARRSWPHWPRW